MAKPEISRLRIIAGKWRRRQIDFSMVPGLRPTHDRIRETLFNWLAPMIIGSRCLDLFAGSGALGFEAASRGAAHVTMIDSSSKVIKMLEQNRRALAAEDVTVLQQTIPTNGLKLSAAPFDLVFLDPPFGQCLLKPTITWLENESFLSDSALIYVECEKALGELVVPESWQTLRAKQTSSLSYFLFQKA